MFPVEFMQNLMQSGTPQLPGPPGFAPIPFEGGLGGGPKPGIPQPGMPQLGGIFGGTPGTMPFQKDAMMQAVMGQLGQPNMGIPQYNSPRRQLLGFTPGGMGGLGGFGSSGGNNKFRRLVDVLKAKF